MKILKSTATEFQVDAARALASELAADDWEVWLDREIKFSDGHTFRWDVYAEKEGESPRVYELVGPWKDEAHIARATEIANANGLRLFIRHVRDPLPRKMDFERVIVTLDEVKRLLNYPTTERIAQRAFTTYAIISAANIVEELLIPLAIDSESRRSFSIAEAARLATTKGVLSQKEFKDVLSLQMMRNHLVHGGSHTWEITNIEAQMVCDAVLRLAIALRDSRAE